MFRKLLLAIKMRRLRKIASKKLRQNNREPNYYDKYDPYANPEYISEEFRK